MTKRDRERRRGERVSTALKVDLGDGNGITRDVSATGIYFEIPAHYPLGKSLRFTVEFGSPGGPMLLKCTGDIVRIERRGFQVGVAVHIVESAMGIASGATL